ncbi:MAG: 3-hydroxyacyl-CoA dehydrogenase [Deltaproteobacteria bacterium]|nr:MAG: 3-hydroxyacyl-CoA dehydrogenase [Deltaproteobacteria bacterium]
MKIDKKIAVITGAGSGLGAATARALASRGAKVGLIDLSAGAAEPLAEELGGAFASCDVSDPSMAAKALEQITKALGTPHILVNCAGITIGREMLTGGDRAARLEKFKKVINVNLTGTLNMISLFAEMSSAEEVAEDEERGVIISTASIAAHEGQIGISAYSASKGGIAALTLPVARELAAIKIRANAISPGYFDTPMISKLPDYVKEGCSKGFVYPDRFGRVEEFAGLVLHIIDNEMINGEVIRLDGAMRLPPSFI